MGEGSINFSTMGYYSNGEGRKLSNLCKREKCIDEKLTW